MQAHDLLTDYDIVACRLLDQFVVVAQRRRLSEHTIDAYLTWVRQFVTSSATPTTVQPPKTKLDGPEHLPNIRRVSA